MTAKAMEKFIEQLIDDFAKLKCSWWDETGVKVNLFSDDYMAWLKKHNLVGAAVRTLRRTGPLIRRLL